MSLGGTRERVVERDEQQHGQERGRRRVERAGPRAQHVRRFAELLGERGEVGRPESCDLLSGMTEDALAAQVAEDPPPD